MALTEVRCPKCNRMLCNVDGGYVEVKCSRCKSLISYNSETNVVRNKGSFSMTEDYQSMKNRVTSSGHRFED